MQVNPFFSSKGKLIIAGGLLLAIISFAGINLFIKEGKTLAKLEYMNDLRAKDDDICSLQNQKSYSNVICNEPVTIASSSRHSRLLYLSKDQVDAAEGGSHACDYPRYGEDFHTGT